MIWMLYVWLEDQVQEFFYNFRETLEQVHICYKRLC